MSSMKIWPFFRRDRCKMGPGVFDPGASLGDGFGAGVSVGVGMLERASVHLNSVLLETTQITHFRKSTILLQKKQPYSNSTKKRANIT